MSSYLGRGYLNSMDRPEGEDIPSIGGFAPGNKPQPLLHLAEIGVSIMATRDVIQPLTAKIREGARKVEIGFMGTGKGSIYSGQITPEGVDFETRRAIRELAKINQVELSTHASVGLQGFAGLTQGGFNESSREQTLQELKRAIDFAAETAGGGAITVHSGEFQRPLAGLDKSGKIAFELFPGEATKYDKEGKPLVDAQGKPVFGKTFHILADEQTGRLVEGVQEDIKLKVPVYETEDYIDPMTGQKKSKIKTDIFENPIPKWVEGKDKKPGHFAIEELNWGNIVERTAQWNKEHPKEQLSPEKMFYKLQIDNKLVQLEGDRLFHIKDLESHQRRLQKIRENIQLLEKPVEESEIKKRVEELNHKGMDITEEQFRQNREEAVKEQMEDMKFNETQAQREIARIQQSSLAYQRQKEDVAEDLARLKPVKEVAMTRSIRTIAEAGVYAFEKQKREKLSRDLFVAPENLFPETFGAHPQELKELIMKSREEMAKLLTPRLGAAKANEEAGKHIRATFDVGHANIWRKYMDRKPGESMEAQDARFKSWLIDQVKDLNKHKIIGHIHVTDNFGYNDEHLTPGMGNTPIVEFVKAMKEAGVTDLIVEPGAQDPAKQYEALYGGWKLFGHSIYGLSAPGKKPLGWEAVEGTYFGNTQPPKFLFGEMALSDQYRGRPFYTGLGLE